MCFLQASYVLSVFVFQTGDIYHHCVQLPLQQHMRWLSLPQLSVITRQISMGASSSDTIILIMRAGGTWSNLRLTSSQSRPLELATAVCPLSWSVFMSSTEIIRQLSYITDPSAQHQRVHPCEPVTTHACMHAPICLCICKFTVWVCKRSSVRVLNYTCVGVGGTWSGLCGRKQFLFPLLPLRQTAC